MLKFNGTVNFGVCQGILKDSVFEQNESIVKINLKIKDERVNPKTGRKPTYVLNFIASGEVAKRMKNECKMNDQILIIYHIEKRFRFDVRTGIGRYETQLTVNDFAVHTIDKITHAANINKGYYQGLFLDIIKIPKATGIYSMSVMSDGDEHSKRQHIDFVVYGTLGEKIAKEFKPGQFITVEYKFEKTKRELPTGETEYYTDCVLEKIG